MRYYSSTAGEMRLAGAVTAAATSITVDTVAGLPGAYPYTVVIDVSESTEEIVTVTDASGDTLTVVRGQDGTSAQSHADQAVVRHMMSARDLREPQAHMDNTSGVHGASGDVVGTTDTQTLSSKTFVPSAVTEPALVVRAKTGQTRNIVEVTSPTGAGTPYFAVDEKGCSTLAGNGVNPPLRVLDRVDDTHTETRFKVENTGDVTIGDKNNTTQSRLIWGQKGADSRTYERHSYVSTANNVVDVLYRDGTEQTRTTLGLNTAGTPVYIVPQLRLKTDQGLTGEVTGKSEFPVTSQSLTKIGAMVVLTFTVRNNSGGAIKAFAGRAGNMPDVTIANISDARFNPAGQPAVLTFRGYNENVGATCGWGFIGTDGAVTLSEFANENCQWAAGGTDEIAVTATYATTQE